VSIQGGILQDAEDDASNGHRQGDSLQDQQKGGGEFLHDEGSVMLKINYIF
jgi:hypothetical protein